MPIISCQLIENKNYRITTTLGSGMLDNIVITKDGLYSIYYIRDGKSINHTGKILNIILNDAIARNNYILFDISEDNSNRKERIHFFQIQYIKDVTPNNAYQIAIQHGFVGTIEDWLESMRGNPGKDAYEIAVDCGFIGTREDWIESLKGKDGLSVYELAIKCGFIGTEEEWLESLKGKDGKDAYELAVEDGFTGTKEEWLAGNNTIEMRKDLDDVVESLTWKTEIEEPDSE